jgi:hypothetical protein
MGVGGADAGEYSLQFNEFWKMEKGNFNDFR